VQRAAVNHALKSFGGVTRWMGLFDVDEYFQLNDTHADAVERGDTTLVQLLDGRPSQVWPAPKARIHRSCEFLS
jgi:hypothetical protein